MHWKPDALCQSEHVTASEVSTPVDTTFLMDGSLVAWHLSCSMTRLRCTQGLNFVQEAFVFLADRLNSGAVEQPGAGLAVRALSDLHCTRI